MIYVNLMTPDVQNDLKIFSKPLPLPDTAVLVGFPGSGLVGSIALQYMVDQLDFELIGTMTSKFFPPLAMINKDLTQRSAVPESAQIKDSGDGYKYGTGNQALKVSPSDPEYLKYQATVRGRIIQEWVLPLRYVEEGGARRRCGINVIINMDGDVTSASWEQQPGDPTFDASAMRAVRKASPFPKPPDRLAWEAYNEGFLVEFDPRLKPQ